MQTLHVSTWGPSPLALFFIKKYIVFTYYRDNNDYDSEKKEKGKGRLV